MEGCDTDLVSSGGGGCFGFGGGVNWGDAVAVWIVGSREGGGEGDADILGVGVSVGCGGRRVEIREPIVIVIVIFFGGCGGWGNDVWV